MIGEVVSLRDRFNWFEKLPLFGQRIVVTRDRRQAHELAEPLEELGAEVILVPAIEICPPSDTEPLDQAIARLRTYDWLIFTSVNGVRFFMERLDASPRRSAGPQRQDLRHRPCHARSGGGLPFESGSDAAGIRRGEPGGGLHAKSICPAAASCCLGPRWRAMWFPRN